MEEMTAAEQPKTFSAWVKRQNAGLWFGLGYLAFSILFFVVSFDLLYKSRLIGAGPGMYPRWLTGLSILVAIAYIWQSCHGQVFRVGECFPGRKELANVATVFLSCMVFVLLLNHTGFIIAGTLLLLIMFVPHYKLWQAVLLSIGISLVCYGIFKICFSVPLP